MHDTGTTCRKNLLQLFLVLFLLTLPSFVAANGYWFDLLTEDSAKAEPFYQKLFGWEMQAAAPDYWLIRQGGNVIGGMAQIANEQPDTSESLWLFALPVDNVAAALEKARRHGASVHHPVDSAPGIGTYAVIIDPQGAPVTLRKPPATETAGGGVNTWGWAELWTNDPGAAAGYYAELGATGNAAEGGYTTLVRDNSPWGGIAATPFTGVKPIWVPYITVKNLEQTLVMAKQAGGQVLVGPQKDLHDGRIALLLDPTGAAFLVAAETP